MALLGASRQQIGHAVARAPVLALLKRRWILLSYAVVILPCTMINRCLALWHWNGWMCYVGAGDGNVGIVHGLAESILFPEPSLNAPSVGTTPYIKWRPEFQFAVLPIWFVLVAILSCILFRELRWRKKREKSGTGF